MDNSFINSAEFSKSFFSDLESNPYLPVFWIDAKGKILNVNEAVCRYLGYTADEMKDFSIWDIDASANPEKVGDLVDFIRRYRINKFEAVHVRKDGSNVDVEIVSSYYCVDGLEFSFNYVFDISDRKQKERAIIEKNAALADMTKRLETMVETKTCELNTKIGELQASEQIARQNEDLFVQAFKTSQDAINLNDIDDGTYLRVNDGFCTIMGYEMDEVIGKSSLELNIWKDANDRINMVKTVKKYGRCHNFEADFVRRDGKIVHGIMSASIQEYKGKKVLLNVSKDITKLKTLENELKALNEKLQNRIEEEVATIRKQQEIIFEQKKLADMGMMINAIAHLWRQPLNVIGLRSQDIAETYRDGALTDRYVDDFERDQMRTVDYLSSTIDDFRTFFKPDVSETEFDVAAEITGLLKLIEIQLLAKGIKVFVSCLGNDGKMVRHTLKEISDGNHCRTIVKGYKGEFKQVMTNLIYNSIYAIDEKNKKGLREEGVISVSIRVSGGRIYIYLEDNGGGISDDVKPYIFNPYYTTKTDGKGTGLGLYLAKVIIEHHMNGTITASDGSMGAVFEISLPACGVSVPL